MYQINVSLSENQIRKAEKGQTNLRLKRENLVGPHPLQVGKREFNKWNKAREKGTGVVIQARVARVASGATGGSLLGLAAAAAPMAAKALGLAGLSFGAEKLLGKIFGSGAIPPDAIQLAKMVEMLTQDQKKIIRNFLKGQGIVQGAGQKGGFLGLLASLGIPLAISLVKKVLGRGISLQPRGKIAPRGKGMFLEPPPPVWGRWGKKSLWTLP